MRSPNMQPATDPATRAFHEQILRTAGLWAKPHADVTDPNDIPDADQRTLDAYESEER